MGVRPRTPRPLTTDERAWLDRLVRECGHRLLAYVRHSSGKQTEAEEIMAETFCRAAANMAALRRCGRQELYLLTVARNLCCDHFRRPRQRGGAEPLQDHASLDPEPHESVARHEQRRALRAELEETRALVHALREGLRPEPLPEALVRRIEARIDQQTVAPPGRVLRPFRVAGLAVAAVVVLAVVGLWSWPRVAHQTSATPTLSADEAAEIVAVYALLAWSGPLDYSIEQVRSELDDVEEQVAGTSQTPVRAWGSQDDWDVPLDDGNTVLPPPESPICRASGAKAGQARPNDLCVF